MNAENAESKNTKRTIGWQVTTWTLSRIITISFCLNLHDISTCVQFTCKLVLNLQIPLRRVQLGLRQ